MADEVIHVEDSERQKRKEVRLKKREKRLKKRLQAKPKDDELKFLPEDRKSSKTKEKKKVVMRKKSREQEKGEQEKGEQEKVKSRKQEKGEQENDKSRSRKREKSRREPDLCLQIPVSEFEKRVYREMDLESHYQKKLREEQNRNIRKREYQQQTREQEEIRELEFDRQKYLEQIVKLIESPDMELFLQHTMRTGRWIRFATTPKSWASRLESKMMHQMIQSVSAEFRNMIVERYGAFRVSIKKTLVSKKNFLGMSKKPYWGYGFFVKFAREARPRHWRDLSGDEAPLPVEDDSSRS